MKAPAREGRCFHVGGTTPAKNNRVLCDIKYLTRCSEPATLAEELTHHHAMRKSPRLELHLDETPAPPNISDRAIDNLRFIRDTMERAGAFTALSGKGIAATGLVAAAAAAMSGTDFGSPRWLLVWVASAAVAFSVSASFTLRKARALSSPLTRGIARKLALAFFPSLMAGAVFTAVALRAGWFTALPGIWLLTYGASVMAGGALSSAIVPVMGALFMLLGAAALGAPLALARAWSPESINLFVHALMLAGFGGLHVLFGWLIARRHGG